MKAKNPLRNQLEEWSIKRYISLQSLFSQNKKEFLEVHFVVYEIMAIRGKRNLIVLIGNFNPAIFHPAWIEKVDVFPPPVINKAETSPSYLKISEIFSLTVESGFHKKMKENQIF